MLKDVPLVQGLQFRILEPSSIQSEYSIEGYFSMGLEDCNGVVHVSLSCFPMGRTRDPGMANLVGIKLKDR